MDRDTRKQAQLACQISLGLMAGIFSVIPTAAASPVHDTSSSLNTGAAVTKSETTTTVAGKQENNVVAWKDFSVAKGETVHFNGSTADARDYNYLNIVTGANTSHIAGTVEGGKNVYIVNQHGVIIDKDATVNVGNLYVSTKPVNDAMKSAFTAGSAASTVLAEATENAAADVVNLGTIKADAVQVEGKNIRFLDSAKVQTVNGGVNTNVTLNAQQANATTGTAAGYAHVGNASGSNAGYASNGTIDYYTLVNDADGLQNIKNDLTKNYMLSQNIDASTIDNFEPIGNDTSTPFTGKFDGMFYEVQNLNVSTDGNAGLFGNTSGARIENVGVVGATIAATGDSGYAGSVVGNAIGNTAIQNVYSETSVASDNTVKGSVSGETAGGLVGYLEGTLSGSYNTTSVKTTFDDGVASGVVGRLESGSITDAYNTGTVAGERSTLSGITYAPSGASVTRVYNTYKALKLVEGQQSGLTSGKTFDATDTTSSADTAIDKAKHISTYIKSGTNTSNADKSWTVTNGNTTVSAISTDGTTNTTWRLYEGQSTPLLTAFFQGTTTADYSYNYFTKDGTTATSNGFAMANKTPTVAVNGGEDLSGFTYNGQYLKIAAPATDGSGNAVTSTTTSDDADKVKSYVSFGSNVDSTDSNISINTAGVKDVAIDGFNKVTGQSLIYSGQHGYNIVGGKVTIGQREVTVSNDLTGKKITKTYDGTKTVSSSDVANLFSGAMTSGLIEGDDTVDLTFDGTAAFDSKDAGKRSVTLEGNLKLKNTSGYNNYNLADDAAASFNNATVTGIIKKKALTITKNDGVNLTREYNGHNTQVATDGLITDADTAANVFSLSGIVQDAVDDTTNEVRPDTVTLGLQDGVTYSGDYVDATTTDGTTTYTKKYNADDHQVEYAGLKLDGTDADNYYLVDGSGNTIYQTLLTGVTDADNVTNNVAVSKNLYLDGGKITKKNIAINSFTLPGSTSGATKVYDGDAYLDTGVGTVLHSDDIVSYTTDNTTTYDDVNFKVTTATSGDNNGHSAWFSKSTTTDGTTTTEKVKNVGTGYDITYNVEISGADVGNYTLNGNDITLDATTQKASGEVTGKTTDGVVNSITKRLIKLGLGTTTSGIDKEYDGDNKVYVTDNGTKRDALTMADGYVAYADGTTANTTQANAKTGANVYKIIDGDNVTLDITGTYADADGNVHVDSSGNPEAQNITYTVALSGDTNGNYQLDDSGATSTTITSSTLVGGVTQTDAVTPTGTITPRTITAKIGTTLTKTYDTLANTYYTYDGGQVGGTKLTSDNITITSGNLVNDSDKASIFTDTVMDAINASGSYGYTDADGFHESADVLTGDNATNATARFTGFASGSNNYKLSTEPVYADGSKITPYEITDIDLATNTITKVYDATSKLATSADNQNAATTAASYISGISATHNGQQIDLSYTVGDDDAYYIHKSDTDTGTATKNVTEANAARFLVKIDTTSPNYTIASSLLNDGKVQLDTAAGTASITPRTVLAKVKDTSEVTKTYDGFSALDHSDATKKGDNIVTLTDVDGTSAGLLTTLDNATNTSTGKFRTKDVAYNHTYDADGNDTGSYQKKDIDYYVTLDNGDTTTQGNYAIYAADGYNQAAGTGTAIAYDTQSDALKGQGTITAKTLGVNFDTVTKTFTNTTSLEDGSISTTNKGAVGAVTGYTDLVTTNERNAADDVTATADVDKSHYDTAWKGDDKTVTYVVSFTGDDVGNYRLSDTSAPLIATTAANPQTYETTTKGNTIGTKDITSEDDIDVAFETVTKVYDGSQNVDYDHTDASVYYEGEQGKKTSADYVKTTDANKTGLKLGGISIAKDQYKIVNDATYDSAGTDASKATFHIEILDKNVLEGFNFKDGLLSNGNTLSKTTNGTITAKKFDFTFTPLENHSQVYNGKTTVVDNSQEAPTASAKDLSDTITNVAGLVNKQDASVLNLAVAGAYDNANAEKGKTITYGVTFNNGNYQFRTKTDSTTTPATVTSYDGTGTLTGDAAKGTMTYTGTGDIEQKTLTVNVGTPLVKDYDGSAKVLDDSLKTVTFDGLVNGETLTPTLNTSTGTDAANGLTGTYVSSRTATAGQDEADVEWDEAANAATWKAVKLSNIDKAFENATGTANKANYKLADDVPGGSITFAKDTQKGKINPLTITSGDVTTSWGTITKEYDNTTNVLNPENYFHINVNKTTSAGKTISTEIGYNLQSATYAGKDVGSYDVTYTFNGLKDTSLRNYKLGSDVTDTYAAGKTAKTTGTITPRKIYAQFDSDVTRALTTKEYNGDNTLTGADKTQAQLSAYVKTTNLLTDTAHDDGAKVDVVTTFADKNVAYDSKDDVTTKDMKYTLSIGSKDGYAANASNYVFVDQNGNELTNNQLTDTNGGKITPKEITVTGTTLADKTYDTNNTVDTSGVTFTLDGVLDSGFNLNSNYVTGTYDDAHVTRAAQSKTGVSAGKDAQNVDYYYKGVTYNFQNVLQKMRKDNGNIIAGNYKISDTKYFDEAARAGVIRPLAITAAAVRETWKPITREYNGSSDIADTLDDAKQYLSYDVLLDSNGTPITDARVTTGTTINIPYVLDSAKYYNNAGTQTQKDVGNNLTATYVISDFAGTSTRDFAMGNDVKNVVVKTHQKTGGITAADEVSITPKVLNLSLDQQENINKTYDATTTVKSANTLYVDGEEASKKAYNLASDDNVSVALVDAYGAYTNKNASASDNDRTIEYTAKLTGNDKGNYTLSRDTTKGTHVYSGDAEEKSTLTATGTIAKRKVYVDFKDSKAPENINKEYGTTYELTANADGSNIDDVRKEVDPTHKNDVVVVDNTANDADSGIVTDKDTDVTFAPTKVSVQYEDGNVKRTDSGAVTTQAVLFDASNAVIDKGSGAASNYEVEYLTDGNTKTVNDTKYLAGQGTITPKTIALSYDNATGLAKTYDGTSDISGATYVAGGKTLQQTLEAQEASLLLPTDTLNLTVTGDYTGTAETEANGGTKNGAANIHSNKTEGVDDGKLGVDASVAWTNGNYDVTFKAKDTSKEFDVDTDRPIEKNTATGATEPNQFTFTKGVKTTQGTINPKKLTVTGNDSATKVYDGNEFAKEVAFTANSMPGVTFDGVVDHDKQVNSLIATGDATYYNEAGTALDANAGVAEDSDALAKHQVQWKLTLKNQDYTLDTDTAKGAGTITRAPLTVTSNSVSTRYGQTPTFTGTVTGWKTAADEAAYNAAVAANPSLITWNTAPGAPSRGSSSIYGWYRYDNAATAGQGWSFDPAHASSGTDFYARKGADAYRNFGNYGRNYQFVQVPGTYTSQADAPKMDDVNPAKHFRPDMEAYNYASHDEAGTAIRDPKAGIEYKAGGTSLRTDDSSSYTGTMKVEGAGDIVNLTQSGTQASADRVDLTGEGANYTLSGAEDVPTADVTVADVTELADELANVTDTTATAATTTTTTVTDDDDDVLKEATETTTREADAAVENTETATAATELFSDTITGTNIAS